MSITNTSPYFRHLMTIFVLLLVTTGQFAIDTYLPSLPAMMQYFKTTETLMQFSLPLYLIAVGVSQIFYGPLSDSYGRKRIMITGLSIFIFASLIVILAKSIIWLLLGRFLQGVGMGAMSVLWRAIMRDSFEGKELIKVSSYSAVAWSIIPIIAPIIGGYLQTYFGWRMNFIFLTFYAIGLLFFALKWLPETNIQYQNQKSSMISLRLIWKNYQYLLTHVFFMGYVIAIALIFGVIIVFNVAAPFLLQNELHQTPVAYGWTILFAASGYLLGAYGNSRLIARFALSTLIQTGFIIASLSGLVLFLVAQFGIFNIFSIIIPIFFIFLGIGVVYPNCAATCMRPFPHIAGSAGAIYGLLVFVGSGLASIVMAHFKTINAKPFATVILILIILAYVSVAFVNKKNLDKVI